jgi:hypothetical protein
MPCSKLNTSAKEANPMNLDSARNLVKLPPAPLVIVGRVRVLDAQGREIATINPLTRQRFDLETGERTVLKEPLWVEDPKAAGHKTPIVLGEKSTPIATASKRTGKGRDWLV